MTDNNLKNEALRKELNEKELDRISGGTDRPTETFGDQTEFLSDTPLFRSRAEKGVKKRPKINE